MNTNAGTFMYRPPDYEEGEYNYLVDMWAIGIMIFELIAEYPFELEIIDGYERPIFKEIKFDHENWNSYPMEIKSFVQKLLTSKDKRMTASQASKHPWI